METYEEYVEEGKQVVANYQWRLGELAQQVTTEYGDHTLERYAQDIGVNYETLRRYRQVAAAYENGPAGPNLSWAHYKNAAPQPDRYELLDQAEEEGWSEGDLREHIRSIKRRYLYPCQR